MWGWLVLICWVGSWAFFTWLIGKMVKSYFIGALPGLILSFIVIYGGSSLIQKFDKDTKRAAGATSLNSAPKQDDFWARGEREIKAQQTEKERREAKWQLDESRAIALVWLTRSKNGGTIKDFFEQQSRVPAIKDLGWDAKEVTDGFIVEKKVKVEGLSSPAIYRWKVLRDETVTTVNGKAMDITQ